MKRLNLMGSIVLLGLATHATPAEAALIAYEGFDYPETTSPPNAIAGETGGSGWTSAWSSVSGGTLNATSPGATYPGLSVTGNMALITPTSGTTISTRAFSTPLINSGTVYISALFDKTNTGTRFFGMQLLDGTTQRGIFGNNSGQANWTMSSDSSAPGMQQLTSTVPTNTTNQTLLVLRVDFDAFGTSERVSLFVNPTPGVAEPAPDVASTAANAFSFVNGINGIGLAAGFTSGAQTTSTGTFDEIHIGTEWSDVVPAAVPEPAGLAVLSVGALALMRRGHAQHTKVGK